MAANGGWEIKDRATGERETLSPDAVIARLVGRPMSTAVAESAPVQKPAGRRSPFSGFERMVAWRYLRSRRKETVISVIASISFVGIMLGVATLIIVHGGHERVSAAERDGQDPWGSTGPIWSCRAESTAPSRIMAKWPAVSKACRACNWRFPADRGPGLRLWPGKCGHGRTCARHQGRGSDAHDERGRKTSSRARWSIFAAGRGHLRVGSRMAERLGAYPGAIRSRPDRARKAT